MRKREQCVRVRVRESVCCTIPGSDRDCAPTAPTASPGSIIELMRERGGGREEGRGKGERVSE